MENDDLLDLLKFFYRETKEDERNLSLRKNRLVSYIIISFSLLLAFLSFVFENIYNITNLPLKLSIFGFLFFMIIALFFFMGWYIKHLDTFQHIHLVTSLKIEKKIYKLLKEKKKEYKMEEILDFLPQRRFIDKAELYKKKWCTKWFHKTLTNQKEGNPEDFLNE